MNTLILLLVLTNPAFLPTEVIALTIGEKAPPFEASSTHGTVRLTDYQGKKHVVVPN